MGRRKGFRKLAEDAGIPLSNDQLRAYQKYGLLPDDLNNKSPEMIVNRLRQIKDAERIARSLNRRQFYLHDREWPVSTEAIRVAVTELAPSMKSVFKKYRALYSVHQYRNVVAIGDKRRRSVPKSWRLPPQELWQQKLSAFENPDLRILFYQCFDEISYLRDRPGMNNLSEWNMAPFEEFVVLSLIYQVSFSSLISDFQK